MISNPASLPNKPSQPRTTPVILILDVCALAGIIRTVVLIAESFSTLPQRIPIHYAITGEANGYGSKWLIWVLPAVATLIFTILTLAQRKPDVLKYPVPLTADNFSRQLHNVRLMFCFIKMYVAGIMLFLTYQTIRNANNSTAQLSSWFLPVLLVTLFAIITIFVYRSYRLQ